METLYIIIAIIVLYIFIGIFFYLYIMPKRAKRIDRAARLVPFSKIDDPKELEKILDKLTDEQLQEYEKRLERDKYKIDNLGDYLMDRFDKMKIGDYRRDFILEIIYRFRLKVNLGIKNNSLK